MTGQHICSHLNKFEQIQTPHVTVSSLVDMKQEILTLCNSGKETPSTYANYFRIRSDGYISQH